MYSANSFNTITLHVATDILQEKVNVEVNFPLSAPMGGGSSNSISLDALRVAAEDVFTEEMRGMLAMGKGGGGGNATDPRQYGLFSIGRMQIYDDDNTQWVDLVSPQQIHPYDQLYAFPLDLTSHICQNKRELPPPKPVTLPSTSSSAANNYRSVSNNANAVSSRGVSTATNMNVGNNPNAHVIVVKGAADAPSTGTSPKFRGGAVVRDYEEPIGNNIIDANYSNNGMMKNSNSGGALVSAANFSNTNDTSNINNNMANNSRRAMGATNTSTPPPQQPSYVGADLLMPPHSSSSMAPPSGTAPFPPSSAPLTLMEPQQIFSNDSLQLAFHQFVVQSSVNNSNNSNAPLPSTNSNSLITFQGFSRVLSRYGMLFTDATVKDMYTHVLQHVEEGGSEGGGMASHSVWDYSHFIQWATLLYRVVFESLVRRMRVGQQEEAMLNALKASEQQLREKTMARDQLVAQIQAMEAEMRRDTEQIVSTTTAIRTLRTQRSAQEEGEQGVLDMEVQLQMQKRQLAMKEKAFTEMATRKGLYSAAAAPSASASMVVVGGGGRSNSVMHSANTSLARGMVNVGGGGGGPYGAAPSSSSSLAPPSRDVSFSGGGAGGGGSGVGFGLNTNALNNSRASSMQQQQQQMPLSSYQQLLMEGNMGKGGNGGGGQYYSAQQQQQQHQQQGLPLREYSPNGMNAANSDAAHSNALSPPFNGGGNGGGGNGGGGSEDSFVEQQRREVRRANAEAVSNARAAIMAGRGI